MRYYRCRCGHRAAWSTIGVNDCDGCPDCNTTLEESPEAHREPTPHSWVEEWQIDQRSGARWKERICVYCHTRERIAGTEDPAPAVAP